MLFTIGLAVAGIANMSPVTIGQRLWSDASFRSIVNAEAADALATSTPTTTTTLPPGAAGTSTPAATDQAATSTTTLAPGPLQRAQSEYERIHQLDLPAGWGSDNQPQGAGWWAAILGWLITAFGVTLGAPFWFDVLNKVSRLKTSGLAAHPPTRADSTKPSDANTDSTAATSSSPAPSEPATIYRMKPSERAVVIASATSISGKSNFSALYRALDIAGPRIAASQLHNSYSTIKPLHPQECTKDGIVTALAEAAADVAAVDLILMVHGEPDQLVLSDGTDKGSTEVAAVDLAKAIRGNPALTGKLRLCYSTACYGQSHADSFLGAGFVAVIGARGVNSNSGTELPLLLQHWTHGESIASAIHHADDPILRAITDTIARHSFQGVNSEKVLVGDKNLTIDTRPVQ
jgi:hypothetical protein